MHRDVAQKYYVVWAGRRTGIFTDWDMARQQVDKFAGARYKSFPTREEAELAFRAGRPAASPAKLAPKKAVSKTPAVADEAFDIQIYCDGACEPNPGNAGSGIAVYRKGILTELWYGLHHPRGTNNTAELNALHQALLMAEAATNAGETVQVLSDSSYAINCVSVWAASWEKRGWSKKNGEIKNLEIIKTMYALYTRIGPRLRLTHVSAHVGVEGNELADRMAMLAVQSREKDLRRYTDEIDVAAVLRMRAG